MNLDHYVIIGQYCWQTFKKHWPMIVWLIGLALVIYGMAHSPLT